MIDISLIFRKEQTLVSENRVLRKSWKNLSQVRWTPDGKMNPRLPE